MKTILSVIAGVALLTDMASAIPQSFGGNNLFGATGMPFEKYVATVAVWSPGATLQGAWKRRDKAKADGVEMLQLGADATVFGIAASQVFAERVNGVVRRITVLFDEAKLRNAKARAGGLYDQVLANITAVAGEAQTVSSGGKTFRHEASLITARRAGSREVIVEFTPAK